MLIYILNLITNIIIGFFLLPQKNEKDIAKYNRNKKIYLFITTVQLALLSGLRSTQMTWDTGAYKTIFNQIPSNIAEAISSKLYVERGFVVFCSIIKMLGGDFQIMLLVSSFFIIGSVCIFIYRHSKNPLFSVFILICLPYYYSTYDLLRHFMAISVILLGYKYIEDNKFIKYLIMVLIASLFHKIALLFIPLYFIKKIKPSLLTIVCSIGITGLTYFSINKVSLIVGQLIGNTNYTSSDWIGTYGGGIKTAIMYLVIFVVSALAYKNLKVKDTTTNKAYIYTLIALCFSIIFINARMVIRLVMTMGAFLAIALPELLDKNNAISKKDNSVYKLCIILICLVYHSFMLLTSWQNVVPYIPFWK